MSRCSLVWLKGVGLGHTAQVVLRTLGLLSEHFFSREVLYLYASF